jgi:hypothetical protein
MLEMLCLVLAFDVLMTNAVDRGVDAGEEKMLEILEGEVRIDLSMVVAVNVEVECQNRRKELANATKDQSKAVKDKQLQCKHEEKARKAGTRTTKFVRKLGLT